MELKDMDRELTRLADIEAIKQLKYRYAGICDDDHNPDKITSLFVEDGIWEGGPFGTAKGHAEIRKLFQGFQKMIDFSQHNMMNPIIEVHGDKATGEWYLMGPYRLRDSKKDMWLTCMYKDDYVKINGQWKHQHLRATPRLWVPHAEGWAKELTKF
jgi:hypothetical protein